MEKITCFFDGATEPRNPGGAMGMGAIVFCESDVVYEHSSFVPQDFTNTNNIAEYLALELVIDFLLDNNVEDDDVLIQGDSQLVIKQMQGEWSIKQGAYTPHAERCWRKLALFSNRPKLKWIPRAENQRADDLSKRELLSHNIKIMQR